MKWPKIYQMDIKYTIIFHCKTILNLPNLVGKYAIWQPRPSDPNYLAATEAETITPPKTYNAPQADLGWLVFLI
jgi:hypothetical protein